MDQISIVIPCFNEEEVLELTAFELEKKLFPTEKELNCMFQVVFIDDGSTDKSAEIMENISSRNVKFRFAKLSRNFGHQAAVSAGLSLCKSSDAIVLLDADLQDPISVIPEMIRAWREGKDVVYGQRIQRVGESRFKLRSAHLFYRLLNKMSDVSIPLDVGDFRLISSRVAKAISQMPESDLFIRGMIAWAGFEQGAIPYVREARAAGESKYPFKKMISFALDGLLSFSNRPLRLATYLGVFATTLSLLLTLYFLIAAMLGVVFERGWLTIIVLILLLGGAQLLTLGVIGEYLGRTYIQTKNRPNFLIERSSWDL